MGGLIRPSFVLEPATQDMRALLRTRKQPVREQASHVQRLGVGAWTGLLA